MNVKYVTINKLIIWFLEEIKLDIKIKIKNNRLVKIHSGIRLLNISILINI